MSTRGCITRVDGEGFRGVYNHFVSYPDVFGKRLYEMAQGRDLGDLMRELIDEHPAGWIDLGEECICHGKHQDGPLVVTDENSE